MNCKGFLDSWSWPEFWRGYRSVVLRPFWLAMQILTIILCLYSFAFAGVCLVTSVYDGDTFHCQDVDTGNDTKIRLWGIDTPEKRQAGGIEARDYLADMILGKIITWDAVGKSYDRAVALVTTQGQVIQKEMVASGHAWVEPRYCKRAICKEWQEAQDKAAADHVGLWSEEFPVAPWEWRRKK